MKLGRPRDHRREPAAKNPDLRSRCSPCFYSSSEQVSDPDGHALVSQTCSPLRIYTLSLQEGSSRKLWLLAKSRVIRVWDNLFDLLLYVIICLLLGWWRHTCSLFCIFSFLLYLGKTLCESPKLILASPILIPCSCFLKRAFAFSAIGPSGFRLICRPLGTSSSAIGRIGSGPRLLDLFSSCLAIVLATCALGGSGSGPMDGYLTVEANDASLLCGCTLGVAIVNSSGGRALLDLDFSQDFNPHDVQGVCDFNISQETSRSEWVSFVSTSPKGRG